MSNPNIVEVTSISGKTACAVATASPVALVTNAALSGTVLKLNTILAANVSNVAVTITLDLYRNSTSYQIAPAISVPAKSLLTVLGKDTAIYLEEGDALRVSSNTASALSVTASYEILA